MVFSHSFVHSFQDCCTGCASFSVLCISLSVFVLKVHRIYLYWNSFLFSIYLSLLLFWLAKLFMIFSQDFKSWRNTHLAWKLLRWMEDFVEKDLRAQGSQVKSDLGSAMQKHIPAGENYLGELLCEPLVLVLVEVLACRVQWRVSSSADVSLSWLQSSLAWVCLSGLTCSYTTMCTNY